MRERVRRSFHRFVDILPNSAESASCNQRHVTTLASVHLAPPSYYAARSKACIPLGDMRLIST